MDEQNKYFEQYKNNPIQFVESMTGKKLSLYQKLIFKIQLKFRKRYNNAYNFLWCLSKIWNKLE